ncbi:MAG: TVP38/TMEM64 family protein [Bacteriovoracaceae bacterium]
MKYLRFALFILIIAAIIVFYKSNANNYLDIQYLQQKVSDYQSAFHQHPIKVVLIFFLAYVIIVGLSIPGAIVLTLFAGPVFGVYKGAIVVIFANVIGATIAFLISRFLFRDFVQKKFQGQYNIISYKIAREGAIYLLSLRLIPISPFVVINLIMGLTKMSTWKYILITLIGISPGTFIYVVLGNKMQNIKSLSNVFSPSIMMSLFLLGILPFIGRLLIKTFHNSKTS